MSRFRRDTHEAVVTVLAYFAFGVGFVLALIILFIFGGLLGALAIKIITPERDYSRDLLGGEQTVRGDGRWLSPATPLIRFRVGFEEHPQNHLPPYA